MKRSKPTPTRRQLTRIVQQIQVNPEAAEGADGTHVGASLIDLFLEVAYPTRQAQDN
jgi:hypothetical protein